MKKIKLFVLIVAVIGLALAACGDGDGGGTSGNELSGNITISRTLTTGTLLTATYSGNESVSFQWKRGSANVETGASFRPLKSGELTVTVSAIGYEDKNKTVTIGGSDVNMFWWGNYIPETIMVKTQLVGAVVFNIDELVANRDNARKRYDFDHETWDDPAWDDPNFAPDNIILNQDGTFTTYKLNGILLPNIAGTIFTGNLRWEEKKSVETAVKVYSQSPKIVYINPTQGFPFFVYPAEYGKVTILDGSGANITDNSFTHYDISIDGINYKAARITNPFTTNSNMEYRFHW